MTRGPALALTLAIALAAGCTGADKPPAAPKTPADGRAAAESGTARAPDPPPPPTGPPPPRDCTLLAPAIARITAAELADLRATRPANVIPAAEAELKLAATVQTAVLPVLCDRDAWSGAYTACVDAAPRKADAAACRIHLTPTQQDAVATMTRQQVGATSSFGIAECDEWRQVVERLIACDKFPQNAKDSMRQALDQSFQSWQQMVATQRDSIASACKAASDATRQSLTSLGCAM